MIGKRTVTVNRGENLNIFQKWFSAAQPSTNGQHGAGGIGGNELLTLQCLRGKNQVLSLSKSGTMCVVDVAEGTVLAEMDFLNTLQKQYPVLSSDASLEDAVVSVCKGHDIGTNNETPFAAGFCVRVIGQDGSEHLEWHVVVATFTSTRSIAWRVVDYGNAYAPISRCSLLDLHMSKPHSSGAFHLESKWKSDSRRGEDTILLLNTTFSEIDAGSSIALPCTSKVITLNSDAREVEIDCSITATINANGGWEAGLNRRISTDQAATAVKMMRLQRLFAPGRFSLSTIVDTLMHDVPVPFALEQFEAEEFDLALVVKLVCQACGEWAHLKLEGNLDDFDDNHCESFAEFLDMSLLEFTKLCYARKMVESSKASRGSLGVLSLPQGSSPFGMCSLMSDHYGLTVVPVPPAAASNNAVIESEDVDAMLGMSSQGPETGVLQLIGSAVPKRSFDELDVLFAKFCLESPETDTALLSWVVQQGTSLASLIHDQAALQLDSLASDQRTLPALFEGLGSLANSSSSLPEEAAAVERGGGGGAGATQSSSFQSSLKESIAARLVEKEYQKLKKTLVFFSYLVSSRCQATGGSLAAVESTYLQKVVHEFVYTGLIRWFSSVRPSDSTDLRRLFDLDDLFPSSFVLSKRKPFSRNFIDASTLNQSVFGSFWKSARQHGEGEGDGLSAAQRCAVALRPSCLSDFAHYLLQDGHFSCLRRLTALLDVRLQSQVNGFANVNTSEGFESVSFFAADVMQSRIRTMTGMAGFYENLRLYALKTRNGIEISSDDDQAIKQSFAALLRTFLSVSDDSGGTASAAGVSEMLIDNSGDADTSTEAICDDLKVAISHLVSASGTLSPTQRDAMTCLEDTMLRIVEESPLFREVIRIYAREDRLAHLFSHNSTFLRRLFAINHIKDVLEVAKRARVVLQHNAGSEMSLNGNYMLMNFIKETMEAYGDLLDSHPVLNTLMMADYINAWGRIFNAALESNSLDEALSAVVRMVELDDDDNSHQGTATTTTEQFNDKQLVQPWQACLRSLVTLACESGELEWLCNVPEVKVGLVSLTECIIAELSRLSKSRSTVKALSTSGKTTEINYGECLFCFLLNRGIYRDAAGALYEYTSRLSGAPDDVQTKNHQGFLSADLVYRSKALATCLCIFNQMEEQSQAFVLTQKNSSKMLHCVAPSAVENEFLRLSAAQKIQASKARDDFEGLVVALCESREWESVHLALQMCQHALVCNSSNDGSDPSESSSSTSRSVLVPQETLIRCMCSAIDTFASISTDESSTGRVTDIDEFAPYTHQTRNIDSPFRFLIDTLQTLDSKDLNWALHRTAATKILNERPSSPLPANLQSSFLSRPGAVTILLALLVESGHLNEACTIASKLIDNAVDNADRVYLPYDLLDRLLTAALSTLKTFNPASTKEKEDLQQLKGNAESLENNLLKYFRETV